MPGPFIFISKSRVKEGKLDDFGKYLRELAALVEANEPRMIAFEAYANENGTEVSGVQVHPDAESMELHMQVAGEKIMAAFEFLDTQSVEIYGTPSAGVLEMMKQIKDAPVNINPNPLGGFTRSVTA